MYRKIKKSNYFNRSDNFHNHFLIISVDVIPVVVEVAVGVDASIVEGAVVYRVVVFVVGAANVGIIGSLGAVVVMKPAVVGAVVILGAVVVPGVVIVGAIVLLAVGVLKVLKTSKVAAAGVVIGIGGVMISFGLVVGRVANISEY